MTSTSPRTARQAWAALSPEQKSALDGASLLFDTTERTIVARSAVGMSALYERGPDGDQYRYQPISREALA